MEAALAHGLIGLVLAERKVVADLEREKARRLASIGGALGALVRCFRLAQGETQRVVAARTGIPVLWLKRAERNLVRWDGAAVARAAAATGLPEWVLVDLASVGVGAKSVLGEPR